MEKAKGKGNRKATKRTAGAKSAKGTAGKSRAGVKNSLVNNINARKKNGTSRSRKKSTISEKDYKDLQDNWGKDK